MHHHIYEVVLYVVLYTFNDVMLYTKRCCNIGEHLCKQNAQRCRSIVKKTFWTYSKKQYIKYF